MASAKPRKDGGLMALITTSDASMRSGILAFIAGYLECCDDMKITNVDYAYLHSALLLHAKENRLMYSEPYGAFMEAADQLVEAQLEEYAKVHGVAATEVVREGGQ